MRTEYYKYNKFYNYLERVNLFLEILQMMAVLLLQVK